MAYDQKLHSTTLRLRIKRELYDALAELAKQDDLPLTTVFKLACAEYLQNHTKDTKHDRLEQVQEATTL